MRHDVGIDEYIDMIRLKTAVLVGGAMKIGAIVGGATKEEARLIYDFGENLGIAFQLQDDILDVYGDPEKFGKQIGGDIIANKKTYLLLKLQELAGQEDLDALARHASNTTTIPAKIDNVTALYDEYKVKELATVQMKEYLDKAFEALAAIKVPDSQKQELIALSNALMHRES